jgi:hypothetical protein
MYPKLWRGDVGTVMDDRYVVGGHIDDKTQRKKIINYYAKMEPSIIEAIVAKFNEEIANGCLIQIPRGMIVKKDLERICRR